MDLIWRGLIHYAHQRFDLGSTELLNTKKALLDLRLNDLLNENVLLSAGRQ